MILFKMSNIISGITMQGRWWSLPPTPHHPTPGADGLHIGLFLLTFSSAFLHGVFLSLLFKNQFTV